MANTHKKKEKKMKREKRKTKREQSFDSLFKANLNDGNKQFPRIKLLFR